MEISSGEMSRQAPEYYFTYLTQDTNLGKMIASNDPSIFVLKIEQGTQYYGANKIPKFQDLGITINCKTPDWLNNTVFKQKLICPNKRGTMNGNLYSTEKFEFIRISVCLCNETNSKVAC